MHVNFCNSRKTTYKLELRCENKNASANLFPPNSPFPFHEKKYLRQTKKLIWVLPKYIPQKKWGVGWVVGTNLEGSSVNH